MIDSRRYSRREAASVRTNFWVEVMDNELR